MCPLGDPSHVSLRMRRSIFSAGWACHSETPHGTANEDTVWHPLPSLLLCMITVTLTSSSGMAALRQAKHHVTITYVLIYVHSSLLATSFCANQHLPAGSPPPTISHIRGLQVSPNLILPHSSKSPLSILF